MSAERFMYSGPQRLRDDVQFELQWDFERWRTGTIWTPNCPSELTDEERRVYVAAVERFEARVQSAVLSTPENNE